MKRFRFISIFIACAILISLMMPSAYAKSSSVIKDMSVKAKAALLEDLDSDHVLYAQKADQKVYPASLTKVMTALLVLDAVDAGKLSLDQELTADGTIWDGLEADTSSANIRAGEKLTVEELLECLLIQSAGESANLLAKGVSGSVASFVQAMNDKAKELGCTGTHFVNTSGMPDPDHYTTCNDLYRIAKAAMKYDKFKKIVSSVDCRIGKTNKSEERHYYNTNGLLSNMRYSGYVYSSCIGIKTGSTEDAGYCLLSAAQQDGKTLVSVVMGCENPTDSAGNVERLQFSESSRLLKWGFDNFSEQTILDSTFPAGDVKVTLSRDADHVAAVPEGTVSAELPNDISIDDFDISTDLYESVAAPVKKGDVLGTMTVSLDGVDYGTVNLVAANDVEQSAWLARKAALQDLFSNLWVRILAIVLLAAILYLILRFKVFGRRRNSYGGSKRRSAGGGYRGGRRRRK